MTRTRKLLLVALAVVGIAIVTLILAGPSIQRSVFYPKPSELPPVVSQSTEQLLARLDVVLQADAPSVACALKPGLSDTQIAGLEKRGGFHLSNDLRALYRWHNGMAANSTDGLLAGQRFVPLDEAVREQDMIRQQSTFQRLASSVFIGHRKSWIHVLDDGAGDGYFYDPDRTGAEGAFFHHFAEVGFYRWFPSLRNFLAGVIECYESKAVKVGADGKTLEEDYGRTEKIWSRFSKSHEVGM